jgi:hypothetical protein
MRPVLIQHVGGARPAQSAAAGSDPQPAAFGNT